MDVETPEERRRRQKREANARWMAVPENRAKYNARLAEARLTPEGKRRRKEVSARHWANKKTAASFSNPSMFD